MRLVVDLLEREPALSDAVMQRCPEAGVLGDVCAQNTAIVRELVRDAHRSGELAGSFSAEDVISLHDRSAAPRTGTGRSRLCRAGEVWKSTSSAATPFGAPPVV